MSGRSRNGAHHSVPEAPVDRRRVLVLAGTSILSASLGAGAAIWRWARPDGAKVEGAVERGADEGIDGSSTSVGSESTTSSTATSTTSTTAPPGVVVNVLCREAWGAAPPTGELAPHTIDELTVHHTGTRLVENRRTPERIRSFQAGHQRDGFIDLAYHYVIDANGNIYEARSTNVPGETYTSYDPTGHFLAVCDGNFEEQPIPPAQLDALARLLAWASHAFGVPVTKLTGHRDVAATACPGQDLYNRLTDGSLAAAVSAHLAAGVPQLVLMCGPEAQARVQAISNGAI